MNTQNYLDGINALQHVLKEFGQIIKSDEHKDGLLSYYKPDYLFRGVTTYKYEESQKNPGYLRIRSGAAVRLSESGRKYHYAQYIAYIKELISSAKAKFPKSYSEKLTDLDILADLQHNGAATCLVDFSKNILIAIWHACQDGTSDAGEDQMFTQASSYVDKIFPNKCTIHRHDGLLYCYNVTNELLMSNSLAIVSENNAKNDIGELLMRTQKVSDIQAQTKYKFWTWTPSNINERISHQNSVFVFGLERFWVHKHDVKIIVIPNEDKDNILLVLKDIFDISAPSIYCDANGYADSQGKFKRLIEDYSHDCKDNWESQENVEYTNYIKGVKHLLYGNCHVAMAFFQQCDENSLIMNNSYYCADLLYSKAMCNVKNNKFDFAVTLLCSSMKQCEDGLKEPNISIDLRKQYYKKQIQICEKLLGLSYKTCAYGKCKSICNDIMEVTKKYSRACGEPYLLEGTRNYCDLVKIESRILDYLYQDEKGKSISDVINLSEKFINCHPQASAQKCIAIYFRDLAIMLGIIENESKIISKKKLEKDLEDDLEDKLEKEFEKSKKQLKDEFNNIKTISYNPWNFTELEMTISQKLTGDKRRILLRHLGCIENYFDMNNNRYLTDSNIEDFQSFTKKGQKDQGTL